MARSRQVPGPGHLQMQRLVTRCLRQPASEHHPQVLPERRGQFVVSQMGAATELRHRQAVVLGEIPGGDVFDAQGLEVVGVPPQGGGVKRVGAEEEVGPNTPVKPLAAVGFPFGDDIELIELPLPGPVGHRHGAVEGGAPVVGTDAILDPAVGEDVAVFQTRQVDPAVWPAAIVGPLPGLADLFRRNVRFRRSLGRHE